MRLELFFKTPEDVLPVINFLTSSPSFIKSFNIPNKNKNDPLLEVIDIIQKQDPSNDIACHYSLKYNSSRDPKDALKKFECFLHQAKDRGARRLLIVSGSGEKKKVNSLTCLQHLQSINADRNSLGIDLGVAYNPYFPIECDRGNESLRLAEKLETGLVSDIWLQFGSDVTLLRQSLELLYDPAGSFNISGRGVKMIGSLFLPSKAMLARMRFRPWNGVFLSPEYLNDLTVARQTTQSILDIYREFNVEPLIETSIKNSTELEILMDLMDGNLAVWPRTTTQDHIISAHDGDKELDCTMESSHDEAQIRRGRRRFAVEMDAGGAGGADEGCSMVVARTKRRKKSDASNQKC